MDSKAPLSSAHNKPRLELTIHASIKQPAAAQMVFTETNQLRSYHQRPDPFLATTQHFHDSPATGKTSTHGKLYQSSPYVFSQSGRPQPRFGTDNNLHGTGTRSPYQPPALSSTGTLGSTYKGNGTFTVEVPPSTIHYKNPSTLPYSQLTWRSEYTDKYVEQKAYPGYSTLSSRWAQTTRL